MKFESFFGNNIETVSFIFVVISNYCLMIFAGRYLCMHYTDRSWMYCEHMTSVERTSNAHMTPKAPAVKSTRKGLHSWCFSIFSFNCLTIRSFWVSTKIAKETKIANWKIKILKKLQNYIKIAKEFAICKICYSWPFWQRQKHKFAGVLWKRDYLKFRKIHRKQLCWISF